MKIDAVIYRSSQAGGKNNNIDLLNHVVDDDVRNEDYMTFVSGSGEIREITMTNYETESSIELFDSVPWPLARIEQSVLDSFPGIKWGQKK